MAARPQPLSSPRAGRLALALLLALVLVPLAAVLWRARGTGMLRPEDWAAIRFTVMQALLSAGLSVALAIPAARALARRSFAFRGALVTLLGAPFILPVIVAVLGLLAVFGRSGWLSQGLGLLGLPPLQIYGLHGILLAHVFFNLPLTTRLILQGWQSIPAERFRLAAALGMDSRAIARHLEWPMLLRVLPGAFAVVFVICLSSFAVALALGGGPRATTVELAIYQAFRFDFDLGRAALLALVQLALAGAAGLLLTGAGRMPGFGQGLGRPVQRWDARGRLARALDTAWLALVALFLLLPLAAIVWRGVPGLFSLPPAVWQSALNSLAVAAAATAMTCAAGLVLALAANRRAELAGLLGLAISPLVLGTGLFLLINPWMAPYRAALPVTMVVNTLVALPFVLRILVPEARNVAQGYGRLAQSLGMSGRAWRRQVMLPMLRRPLGYAAGLTAALSMGDLGVIALFADPDRATLPLKMYQLMGAYRSEAAAGAALLLLTLSLALFWLLDRGGRLNADA